MGGFVVELLIGLALAGFGGEMFVKGAVGLASWLRVPAGIIGLTVAAFATSSPEMAVSVNAALKGTPQIALGDALGSNVVNIGLILGLALIIAPIAVSQGGLKRDLPVALLAPVITAMMVLDGSVSTVDALLLMGMFLAWLVAGIVEAARERSQVEVVGERNKTKIIAELVVGLAALIAAGHFIVLGAKGIGDALGMSAFVVGATMVSVGTSIPELATAVIARLRGHSEITLGMVLGSNIFNGLLIVSVAGLIRPIAVDWKQVAIGLAFGVLTIALVIPAGKPVLRRRRGAVVLAIYVAYLAIMLQFGSASGA